MVGPHADCTFADFGPKATPVRVDGSYGTAVFERCRFKVAENLAEGQEHAEAMVSSFTGAAVYVRNCTSQNTPGHLSSMLQVRFCTSTASTACTDSGGADSAVWLQPKRKAKGETPSSTITYKTKTATLTRMAQQRHHEKIVQYLRA